MNNNNYSYLVQALHHLVLGNKFVPELLHDIEKLIYKVRQTINEKVGINLELEIKIIGEKENI